MTRWLVCLIVLICGFIYEHSVWGANTSKELGNSKSAGEGMAEFSCMKFIENIDVCNATINIEPELSTNRHLGYFQISKCSNCGGKSGLISGMRMKNHSTAPGIWQGRELKVGRQWIRKHVHQGSLHYLTGWRLAMIDHREKLAQVWRPINFRWISANIGSQLPSSGIISTFYELSSGKPKTEREHSNKDFWAFVPPPIPVRRFLFLLLCGWCGWWLNGLGWEHLNNKRHLIGSALICLGLLLWIGILFVWFISRYPWSWGLPI